MIDILPSTHKNLDCRHTAFKSDLCHKACRGLLPPADRINTASHRVSAGANLSQPLTVALQQTDRETSYFQKGNTILRKTQTNAASPRFAASTTGSGFWAPFGTLSIWVPILSQGLFFSILGSQTCKGPVEYLIEAKFSAKS